MPLGLFCHPPLVVNRRIKVIAWKRNFLHALIAAFEKEK